MKEFDGTKERQEWTEIERKRKITQTRCEKEREKGIGRSERKEAAARVCAATAKLRSQVLVHGRNGRVDRFPSLGSRSSHTKPRSVGGPEWRKHPKRWWKTGEATGIGEADGREPCTARFAMSSVREPPRPFSLSFSHGDSTRCDRNLRRRSVWVIGNPIRGRREAAGGSRANAQACIRAYLCTRGACV